MHDGQPPRISRQFSANFDTVAGANGDWWSDIDVVDDFNAAGRPSSVECFMLAVRTRTEKKARHRSNRRVEVNHADLPVGLSRRRAGRKELR